MRPDADPPLASDPDARGRPGAKRDGGFALVAAVAGLAAFGYIAVQVAAANQGTIALQAARTQQARLAAAADAGLSLALHGLAASDRGVRWSIDGRPRQMQFDGIDLTVVVEDERGKAPLSGLSDAQSRALFAGAGASGPQLDALVAEFRQWQNEDATDPEPGALRPVSTTSATPVRHGPFRTIGELAALKDMDRATFARIAPVVTVFFEENGPFEPSHAQPLAVSAMKADELASPDQINAEGQLANQRPDEELANDGELVGRPLTIRVVARSRGAQAHRMEIVEFTGDKTQPVWIRYVE